MIQPSQRTAIHHSGSPRLHMEATSMISAHGTTVTSIHSTCKTERRKATVQTATLRASRSSKKLAKTPRLACTRVPAG